MIDNTKIVLCCLLALVSVAVHAQKYEYPETLDFSQFKIKKQVDSIIIAKTEDDIVSIDIKASIGIILFTTLIKRLLLNFHCN